MAKAIGIRQKAIRYRKAGYSYNLISKKMGLSKSTMSDWLRGVPFKPNQEVLKRINGAQMKSAETLAARRLKDISRMRSIAKKEIGTLSNRDLMMLGIGIYLGEGSKLHEYVRMINSDPDIIRLSIKWFKKACGLKNENFRPCIHLYPDVDINQALTYWSKITKIPKDRFGKVQVDIRTDKTKKKRGKLPYGTMHLYVNSCGKKELGRSLHRRIMGWIEAVHAQI